VVSDSLRIFAQSLQGARRDGKFSSVQDCLAGVPLAFTESAPACWQSCGGYVQGVAETAVEIVETYNPNTGEGGYTFLLPITYIRGEERIDVSEIWSFVTIDGGIRLHSVDFSPPAESATTALSSISTYFGLIADLKWTAAAEMLLNGSQPAEERTDLRELNVANYSIPEVAAALSVWCRTGCGITAPTLAELKWDGSYYLERSGRTIRVHFVDQGVGVSGLPSRS